MIIINLTELRFIDYFYLMSFVLGVIFLFGSIKRFLRRKRAELRYNNCIDKLYMSNFVIFLIWSTLKYQSGDILLTVTMFIYSLNFLLNAMYVNVVDEKGIVNKGLDMDYTSILCYRIADSDADTDKNKECKILEIEVENTKLSNFLKADNIFKIEVNEKDIDDVMGLIDAYH